MRLKSVRLLAVFMIAAVLASTTALAQTPVPPPPRPPDSGPSLEVTMRFIQEKLSEQGKVNWANNNHDSANAKDWIEQYSGEITKVLVDASACRISYHYISMFDGKPSIDKDLEFSLREVQDIIVLPYDQHIQGFYADKGHPTWSCTSTPPLFILKVRQPKGKWSGFFFKEDEMANRVAKAMVHAVELCGGGSKPEPF